MGIKEGIKIYHRFNTKAKNLEMLENLKHWYKFNFEIIYFYNVYGPKQIGTGNMATVMVFLKNNIKNKALTVVKPGSQSRRFTHKRYYRNMLLCLEKINQDIIVSHIGKAIVSYR